MKTSAPAVSSVNRRVLIVDDNPSIHSDFRKIFCCHSPGADELSAAEAELFGTVVADSPGDTPSFELSSAYQGEEAVEAVARGIAEGSRFTLAFIDVRMPPGMDGVQTTAKLWALDPDLQVIICTAYSDYSWEEMLARLGHSDRLVILKKPFDSVEVLQLASALTEKWQLLQQTKQRVDDLETQVAQRTQHLQQTNERLNFEVQRRTRREQCLKLQNDITRALADPAVPYEKMVTSILEIILQGTDLQVGKLSLVDSQAKRLRCAASAQVGSPALRDAPVDLNAPRDLSAEAWKYGQPVIVASSGLGESGDLAAGFALPLLLENKVVGVLEFRGATFDDKDGTMLEGLQMTGSLIAHTLERRRLEDQLRHAQKMDAIGHLAGGIAHDFNNILTVIQGYAEVLKRKPNLKPEICDISNQIALAAERASMLTRQLLTFSRKQIIQSKQLDLNKVIAQTESMLRRVIREDISLRFNPCTESPVISADEGMLSQVLINLACNARDAMPTGGTLSIATELVNIDELTATRSAEARPGRFVCLRIEDTGCGIRQEDLPHIFEPFFTTKEVGRGTGLGLCTVYGIVKQHHGWIEVSTRLGAGTCFRIFLPGVRGGKVHRDVEDTPENSTCNGETVLLVEDEIPVRSLAMHVLQSSGYRVIEAGSGVEALRLWSQHRAGIDMLLSDVVMPGGVNGAELAERLRGTREDLPVLLVSGYSPTDILPDKTYQQVSFLPKPYSPQKLVQAVRACLEGRHVNPERVQCRPVLGAVGAVDQAS